MKKVFAILICAAILLSVTVSFSAETITSLKDIVNQDLAVDYTAHAPIVSAPAEEGSATVVLPDEKEIVVEQLPEEVVEVKVYPVDEKVEEASEWVQSSVGEKTEIMVTYHVTTVDNQGNEVSNKGTVIIMEVDKELEGEKVTVCALDSNGNVEAIVVSVANGKVTFAATGAEYYVLCSSYDNPPTDDALSLPLCLTAVASLGMLIAVVVISKKRQVI